MYDHQRARRVNLVYHLLAGGERRLAMEVGDIEHVECGRAADPGPFVMMRPTPFSAPRR